MQIQIYRYISQLTKFIMTNISTVKKRILYFIDYKGLSKNKFYIETGISNGVLDKKSGFTVDTIEKIISTFNELSVDWLLTGEGEMLKTDSSPAPAGHYTVIPLIPIDAAAGYGNGEEVVMPHHIAEGYVIPEWTERGVAYIIRVSGNSMYPTHSNGDLLGCRPVKDLSFFQWGKIYVLDTDQGPLVKRLYPAADNADELLCHSDNKDKYPPFSIPRSSIYRIAIVVGVIRFE